jgi:CelD/BcsL family acetyltransferase involved in cellulose biosynthesis
VGRWYRRLESDVAAAVQGRPRLLAARPPGPVTGAVWSARDPLPGLSLALRRVTAYTARRVRHAADHDGLEVTIEELGDRDALATRWRALEARAQPSPYLSWPWVGAWLDVYDPPDPAVVRVGPADAPVALGVVVRAGGRWQFAGAPVSPNRGLLCAPQDAAAAWAALAAELRRRRDWTSLGVEGVPAEAGALPGADLEPMSSWVVPLAPSFDEYLSERSSSQRKGHKQKLRRLEQAGGEVAEVPAADHRQALRAFLEFHTLRAGIKGERHPQMNDDLLALLERLSGDPETPLRLFALRVDRELAGVTVRLDRQGGGWFYNAGFDPAHGRLGPGVLLELSSIRDAIGRGHRRFDLGPGHWRYKTDLGGLEDPAFNGTAWSPAPRARLTRLAATARGRAWAALPGREVLRGVRRRRALRGRAGSSSDPSTAG